MRRRETAIACGLLLAVAIPRLAMGACTGPITYEEDGAIADWNACQAQAARDSFASAGPKLDLRIIVDGHAITDRLHWQSVEDGPARSVFRGADTAAGLEIRRLYVPGAGGSLDHTVFIANRSGAPVTGLRLRLSVATWIPRKDNGQTLADYVYRFQRGYVTSEADGWQSAASGLRSRVYGTVSRHRVFVIESPQEFTLQADSQGAPTGSEDRVGPWFLEFEIPVLNDGDTWSLRQRMSALPADSTVVAGSGYGGLVYADLWGPLAFLSRWIERALSGLAAVAGGFGLAVILLAVLVRLVTMPLTAWSARRQREFALISARIKPDIARAKKELKGAAQSERILELYRQNGLSPLSGLSGSAGLFAQIPFLLAVFSVTTVSSVFSGAGFLWIDDLSLPDALAVLPVTIPLLGNELNALPLLLGGLLAWSSKTDVNPSGASTILPTIITLLIIVAFYSFASALVLYWLTVNTVQVVERVVIRAREQPAWSEAEPGRH